VKALEKHGGCDNYNGVIITVFLPGLAAQTQETQIPTMKLKVASTMQKPSAAGMLELCVKLSDLEVI
jgi:hypothetical protein